MKRQDFHYHLPEHLIAQFPPEQRDGGRLLYIDGQNGIYQDAQVSQLLDFVNDNDLLVFNDTKVIPARLYGHKATGGKVELLLERMLSDTQALTQIRASKSPKPGSEIVVGDHRLEVLDRRDGFFVVASQSSLSDILMAHGHIPLPPYIQREDQQDDSDRYQTLYAETPGAVAAPTAGLHFSESLLKQIEERQIPCAYVTLHVGAGTFQPVRADDLADHTMHWERVIVSANVIQAIEDCHQRGGRVIAVGTTSVRSLETVARQETLAPYEGETNLFLYPGSEFKLVDAMLTNFHLPESTLLMLVCAFAGTDLIMAAYEHAVSERYRFFSYGDACFVTRMGKPR